MKNIGLAAKVFAVFYIIFFPVSIFIIEFLLRFMTPFSIFGADSRLDIFLKIALFDVPPVIIMTAAFCNSKPKKMK
jgi:hypothetical protein